MKNKLIILRGYPGSGKTTLGKALEANGEVRFVDHNSILNLITEITGNDDGIYDEIHKLEQAITKKLLGENKSVIIARGFGESNSIEPYIDIAKELGIPYTVFRIEVPVETLKERVISSERKEGSNLTTTPEALVSWVEKHPMEPIDGEVVLDGTKSIDELVEEIKNTVIK